jgi:hypothetical protein
MFWVKIFVLKTENRKGKGKSVKRSFGNALGQLFAFWLKRKF